ncbi:MAG: glycogen synthase GlgA [Candidatus Zixiibacteriota bacterium]|nr:MAG: glycogen synthase GlgA [candidate division Zixibacteria bacterium]
MGKLKILMAAPEAGPFVRTGGLGDVMSALPAALAREGHDVKVFIPRYGIIDGTHHGIKRQDIRAEVSLEDQVYEVSTEHVNDGMSGAELVFVANPELFDRPDLYQDPATGKDFTDNYLRFAFFCRAVIEIVKELRWQPDVIHVHDWQAALIPVYLKSIYADDEFFAHTRTILTIHNLAFQGLFEAEQFPGLDLPEEMFYSETGELEFYGSVNFLKAGIVMADAITTVSEQYSKEIQTKEFGCGLEGVLQTRADDLHGIVNGVDYSVWSPSRDKLIPCRYGLLNLSGKRTSRVELLGKAGLPIRDTAPLVGMITRLTEQKGLDLLVDGAKELFELNLQMIILGNGEERYHEALQELETMYPDKLKVFLEFNDSLAHQIQAGSDAFLMPSRYEPCGLNQLYALKYGTVPVVRKVGGLADTVIDYDKRTGEGTGFVFEDYDADEMIATLRRVVELYGRRQPWTRLMKAGMNLDYSWDASARKYSELFQSLVRSKESISLLS